MDRSLAWTVKSRVMTGILAAGVAGSVTVATVARCVTRSLGRVHSPAVIIRTGMWEPTAASYLKVRIPKLGNRKAE